MGWTAYAIKEDKSISLPLEELEHFQSRAAEVCRAVHTVDGTFAQGALSLSLAKKVLERAVGFPIDDGIWGPGFVEKALAQLAEADMAGLADDEGDPIEGKYIVGVQAFLEVCADRGLGVRFYP